jgi:prepilin-type N-terminal cleavage/methylation domain-containing protein
MNGTNCEQSDKIKIKGFTLIELIIVIAILAIIAVVIIPRLINVKQESAEGVNNYNMRILQEELENYRTKNDTYPVPPSNAPADLLANMRNTSNQMVFLDKLPKYKDGQEVLKTYECITGATYSITFNDDPATPINESDSTKYEMNQDTDTKELFK